MRDAAIFIVVRTDYYTHIIIQERCRQIHSNVASTASAIGRIIIAAIAPESVPCCS